MTVEQIMSTSVITVEEHETIGHADDEMRWADIRHLPVVDRHRRVVGIISNRDILRALGRARGKGVGVASVMHRDVLSVRPETWAREAVNLMLERKIDALPVVGDDGRLVGIITATDFLRLASMALGGDAEEEEIRSEP